MLWLHCIVFRHRHVVLHNSLITMLRVSSASSELIRPHGCFSAYQFLNTNQSSSSLEWLTLVVGSVRLDGESGGCFGS